MGQPEPTPLRVAHVSPTFFHENSVIGGGERYVYNLARAVEAAPDGAGRPVAQQIIALGPTAESRNLGGIPVAILRNQSSLPSPMSALSEHFAAAIAGADLVHVHQSLTTFGVFATVVAKSQGKRVVATDLGGGQSSLMLRDGGMRLWDGMLSISAYAHSLLGPVPARHALVVIGPIDTVAFSPAPTAPRPVAPVVCVSRLLPHKGIDRVIRALPSGLALHVVGRPYDPAYHALLRELAQGKDVSFFTDADDARLLELYRGAGLFVQASTTRDCYGNDVLKPELMGFTALEAMACGLPVLLSDVASFPELIPDPTFGRLFGSETELADQLEAYRSGAWPRAGAGEAARAQVVTQHSLAAVGARVARFYADVAAG